MTKGEKTHVVVTVATNKKGNVIVRAYGPYTAEKAKRERKTALEWGKIWLEDGETLHASACKMTDIDALNAQMLEGGKQK